MDLESCSTFIAKTTFYTSEVLVKLLRVSEQFLEIILPILVEEGVIYSCTICAVTLYAFPRWDEEQGLPKELSSMGTDLRASGAQVTTWSSSRLQELMNQKYQSLHDLELAKKDINEQLTEWFETQKKNFVKKEASSIGSTIRSDLNTLKLLATSPFMEYLDNLFNGLTVTFDRSSLHFRTYEILTQQSGAIASWIQKRTAELFPRNLNTHLRMKDVLERSTVALGFVSRGEKKQHVLLAKAGCTTILMLLCPEAATLININGSVSPVFFKNPDSTVLAQDGIFRQCFLPEMHLTLLLKQAELSESKILSTMAGVRSFLLSVNVSESNQSWKPFSANRN
jgi:hypothetical protein